MYISRSQKTNEWYPVYSEIQKETVETPDFYLEKELKKKDLGGNEIWKISSTDYIKSAMDNVEEKLN